MYGGGIFAVTMLLLAAAAACGDGSAPSSQPFVFTPYPYTIVPGFDGTPVPRSISESGGEFTADDVMASVSVEDLPAFTRTVNGLGFAITSTGAEFDGLRTLVIRVPVGSVPDALQALQRQPGVRAVSMDSIRH